MKLELLRKHYTATSTIGELTIDGRFECHILEDRVRGPKEMKVWGRTAIPSGTYTVTINTSTRFKCLMPLLLSVPGYEGVRIHPGNTDADTLGCLLAGHYDAKTPDFISDSRSAYGKLYPKLKRAFDALETITISIKNAKEQI